MKLLRQALPRIAAIKMSSLAKEIANLASHNEVSGHGKQKAGDAWKESERYVGKRIKVWWPADGLYYEGEVKSFSIKTGLHKSA